MNIFAGDIYVRTKGDLAVGIGIVWRSGISEAANGTEAKASGFVSVPFSTVDLSKDLLYRSEVFPSIVGDRAKMMLGITFPKIRRVAIWIDHEIFGGRSVVRSLGKTKQTEDGLLFEVATGKHEDVSDAESVAAVLRNNPKTWSLVNYQRIDSKEGRLS